LRPDSKCELTRSKDRMRLPNQQQKQVYQMRRYSGTNGHESGSEISILGRF
jgi:hypothetical protein